MNLDSAAEALARARPADLPPGFTLHQLLVHCAQTIECSLDGYPSPRSLPFRRTLGPILFRFFDVRGSLGHDRSAPIPGAPAIPTDGDVAAARARFERAVERFRGHEGPLAEHFFFGRLTHAQFARLHIMHILDHLGAASTAI